MKRPPLPSVLLALSIIAGFLLLFPVEWVALLVLLLALIAYQVVLVRRHMRVVPRFPKSKPARRTARYENAAPEAQQTAAAEAAPEAAEVADAPPAQTGEGVTPFDPALFSKFREHLETAERVDGKKPSALATPPESRQEIPSEKGTVEEEPSASTAQAAGESPGDAAEAPATEGPDSPAQSERDAAMDRLASEEAEVEVRISPAARRGASVPVPAAPGMPGVLRRPRKARALAAAPSPGSADEAGTDPEEAPEQDLFADLRPNPDGKARTKEKPPKEKKRKPARKKARTKQPATAVVAGDEVSAALMAAPEQESAAGEEAVLMKLTEDALEKGDSKGAKAGLDQVLEAYDGGGKPIPWRIRLAQAHLAVLDGDHDGAVEGFEALLGWHPPLAESEYLEQIDGLAKPLEGAQQAHLRVSMLVKLLGLYRQGSDRPAMDRIYGLIEDAQEQAGDEEKLIQYYKNHLEIKTVLEDVEGQLALIDRIGNRYYKLGDTESAKQFYEQGLKLRAEQENIAESAGSAAP